MNRLPETTADNVVGAVQAVVASRGDATEQTVAEFLDQPPANATSALDLAEDLGLVRKNGATFEVASPIARLLCTPLLPQRAALLRIAVESYAPFRVFREQLHASGGAGSEAAQQTKAILGLSEHRETIKQTMVSLGTYCQSIKIVAGGQYDVRFEIEDDLTSKISAAVAELSEAELRVRDWLSETARAYVNHANVLEPLAESYLKVSQGDSRSAVVTAGNAIESHLSQLAGDMQVNVASAHGLGAKVAAFEAAGKFPKKVLAVGRYLGAVRNAADHGIDLEVGGAWTIRSGTGEDFLRVSITFIEVTIKVKDGGGPEL